jgi:hypothetical protein
MSEIKTEIKQNADGSYTITDAHSTADVVRWLLTQDSKETILYLLGDTPQRTWVGLTEQEQGAIMEDLNTHGTNLYPFAQAIEGKLKQKNSA